MPSTRRTSSPNERLDDDENFVDVRTDEIIEFVEDTINDFDKQVALLVLESMPHEQGEDLVKESTKLACLVSNLTKGGLSYRRGTILDLQEQTHDFALLHLIHREFRLLFLASGSVADGYRTRAARAADG